MTLILGRLVWFALGDSFGDNGADTTAFYLISGSLLESIFALSKRKELLAALI